jgi:cytochrome c556
MADEGNVKTPLEALQDTLSKLKEMAHYSEANIEKLATLWLEVSEHKQQKQYEKMVDEVLKRQNDFQESITVLIAAYEKETAQLKAAAEGG